MMDSVTVDKLDLDINVVANLFLVGNENPPMCYNVNVLANPDFSYYACIDFPSYSIVSTQVKQLKQHLTVKA